jgi:hypothetical protein
MTRIHHLLLALTWSAAAGALAGCATTSPGATAAAMTVRPGDFTAPPATRPRPAFAVADEATVGPAFASRVGARELRRALEGSLEAAGLLSRQSARYVVGVHLEQLEEVGVGPERAVFARIRYAVGDTTDVSRSTEETLVSRFPGLPGTPGVTEDKVSGAITPQQADEGAVRNNLAGAMPMLILLDSLRQKQPRR